MDQSVQRTVTVETVMLAILEFIHADEARPFTTQDIADAMQAPEYRVRAAFSWLVKARKITAIRGRRQDRYTRTAGERYPVAVYRFVQADVTAPVAFNDFYAGYCGR